MSKCGRLKNTLNGFQPWPKKKSLSYDRSTRNDVFLKTIWVR